MVLQSELACCDDGRNLDQVIDLTIRIDNLIRSRCSTRSFPVLSPVPSTSYESEPMQIGFTRLSPEERECRYHQRLCLYCGQSGHMRAACPTCPVPSNPAAVSSFMLPVVWNYR